MRLCTKHRKNLIALKGQGRSAARSLTPSLPCKSRLLPGRSSSRLHRDTPQWRLVAPSELSYLVGGSVNKLNAAILQEVRRQHHYHRQAFPRHSVRVAAPTAWLHRRRAANRFTPAHAGGGDYQGGQKVWSHVTSSSCLGKGPYNTQPRYSIASFRDWDKLWSALTLLTYYNGVKCRIEASPPVTLQLTGSRS